MRTPERPVVVVVPPLATARVREEVRIARASNPRLFSIFPAAPGIGRCAIPEGGIHSKPLVLPGTCETSVRRRPTHEPSVSVTFTETWLAPPPCPAADYCLRITRHHTWQVVEGETIEEPGTEPHVLAIRSRGAAAPQDYK